MYILKRNAQKLKKQQHIFSLETTFYNFTRKIETSWAKKVVKSNVSIIVYVWFIYFRIKNVLCKKGQC